MRPSFETPSLREGILRMPCPLRLRSLCACGNAPLAPSRQAPGRLPPLRYPAGMRCAARGRAAEVCCISVETIHDAHSPSFTAPMDPARYTRRLYLDPHQLVERVTPQRDLFVLAHLGIPHVEAAQWRLAVAGLVGRSMTLT